MLFTDEFCRWWDGLTTEEQDAVDRVVRLLEARGTAFLGGVKTGEERWYEIHVPIADRIYQEYLKEMEG